MHRMLQHGHCANFCPVKFKDFSILSKKKYFLVKPLVYLLPSKILIWRAMESMTAILEPCVFLLHISEKFWIIGEVLPKQQWQLPVRSWRSAHASIRKRWQETMVSSIVPPFRQCVQRKHKCVKKTRIETCLALEVTLFTTLWQWDVATICWQLWYFENKAKNVVWLKDGRTPKNQKDSWEFSKHLGKLVSKLTASEPFKN